MSRTKSGTLPKLQRHKGSGQARVHIAGRDYWCGKWGSAAATAHYHRLIGEFLHGQGLAPSPIQSQPVSPAAPSPWGPRACVWTSGRTAAWHPR